MNMLFRRALPAVLLASSSFLLSCTTPASSNAPSNIPPKMALDNASDSPQTHLTETDKALLAELKKLIDAEIPGLSEKPQASELAQEHAAQLAADSSQTEFKLQVYQPVAPSPLVIRLQQMQIFASDNLANAYLSDGKLDTLKSRFRNQVKNLKGVVPFSHYGLGLVKKGQSWFVSTILLTEIVQLQGLNTEKAQPGTSELKGQVMLPGFSNPRLLVTFPDGQVKTLETKSSGQQFQAMLDFSQTGLYSVEVDVSGPFGPQPASNTIVAVGVPYPQPESTATESQAISDLKAAQQQLLNLVNRDRQAAGLNTLQLDARLSEAAQAHSEDMINNGFVGHNSPTQGSPQQQAALLGVSDLVEQNIAVSRSLERSQRELMSSPGHRKAILNPKHTHVGFGVKKGNDEFLYITQDFVERKLEVQTLPARIKPGETVMVKGKSTQKGFVAAFLESELEAQAQGVEPLAVEAGQSFELPVKVNPSGKQRILIGHSPPPQGNSYQFSFYNIWVLDVQP